MQQAQDMPRQQARALSSARKLSLSRALKGAPVTLLGVTSADAAEMGPCSVDEDCHRH